MPDSRIRSFAEFWPFYVSQHRNRTCRAFHFVGTTLWLGCLAATIATGRLGFLALAPVVAYGNAWIGHFVFEKNRPATFTYPLWSLLGDHVMYLRMCTFTMDAALRKAEEIYPAGRLPGTADAAA